MCRSHQKETIAENTAFLQVKWQDGMVETRFRLLGDHGQVLLIRNELGRMKNDLWEACLPGKRITGMRYHLIPVIFFLRPPQTTPALLSKAGITEPAVVMEGEGGAAEGAEANVVFQTVQEDFVDLLCDLLPPVIEGVLIHRAAKGFGKGEVQV